MSTFKCPRCGYSVSRRLKLEKHFDRVNPCESVFSDINVKKYKDALLLDKGGVVLSIIKRNEKLELEKACIIGNNNNNNNIINSNNNNIDIKITLNPINEPNLDYITEKDANKCLKDIKTAMLEMAKKIFFNTKHPENMSIYKTSCKNKLVKYFKDGGWNVGDQDIVLDIMAESINDGLELGDDSDKYYTLVDEYTNNKKFKKVVNRLLMIECYNNKMTECCNK